MTPPRHRLRFSLRTLFVVVTGDQLLGIKEVCYLADDTVLALTTLTAGDRTMGAER